MGIQAAGNLPLTHFLTDLQKAGRSPSTILEGKISTLKCKAFALSALEKISYVALMAIMAVILAVSYSTVVLTGGLSFVIAGMALATPLIAFGLTKFAMMSQQFSKRAEMERQVLLQLKQIENWTTPEITQFIQEQGLVADRIPLDALRQLNPNEPLRALLPLIARFNFLKARANEIETGSRNARPQLEEAFREKEAAAGKPIDPQIKQKIRFECQDTAWRQHEQEAVPLSLNAAILLDLIQNPSQSLDIEPFSFEIPGVGSSVPKTFAERIFGRNDQIQNDDYFTFHPDLHRQPLTLQAIEQNMDPRNLRVLLLPNAIRA